MLVWSELKENIPSTALKLVVSGGLTYTSGVIIFIVGQNISSLHSLWHLFVIAASVQHWYAIRYYILEMDTGNLVSVRSQIDSYGIVSRDFLGGQIRKELFQIIGEHYMLSNPSNGSIFHSLLEGFLQQNSTDTGAAGIGLSYQQNSTLG